MQEYFVTNFPLLCICLAMGIIALISYRGNKKMSIEVLIILGLTLILSIIVAVEIYAKNRTDTLVLATWMSFLGYVLRPVCLYFFVRIADRRKLIPTWVYIVLIAVNFFMYVPSLFIDVPGMSRFAFYYTFNEEGTRLIFNRGYVNFTSHVISALFLAYIIYLSYVMLQMKHRGDALMIFICAFFVVAAVVLESLEVATNLLNITIAISCVFYYLFINRDNNRRDALTGLFNRKTYYDDSVQLERRCSGIILFDMNCLKYLNDTHGHEAGDIAIKEISDIILKNIKKDMSAYRMGGDEFMVAAAFSKKQAIDEVTRKIQEQVAEKGYSVSAGYSSKEDDTSITLEGLIKNAEEKMYIDKAEFYKNNKIERRR